MVVNILFSALYAGVLSKASVNKVIHCRPFQRSNMKALEPNIREKLSKAGNASNYTLPCSLDSADWVPPVVSALSTVATSPVALTLTKAVTNCSGPGYDTYSCPPDKLIAMDETLDQAMSVVEKYTAASGGHQELVPPLVYVSLARGGKTTFIAMLFDRLKVEGYAPIYVPIKSCIALHSGTVLQQLNRHIALQMSDWLPLESAIVAMVNELRLCDHIERTRAGKGVVLLIDDLHKLGRPLDPLAAHYLHRYWLDKPNRYLVYTSLVAMDLEPLVQMSADKRYPVFGSERGVEIAPHPRCSDAAVLRDMFAPRTVPVSPAEVVLYSTIPSLVYASKQPGRPLRDRFTKRRRSVGGLPESTVQGLLRDFVTAVRTGRQRPSLDAFCEFGVVPAEGKIQWPLLYLEMILSLFPEGRRLRLEELIQRRLQAPASRGGLDWALVIQVAVLLQCLDSQVNDGPGPLGIVAAGERVAQIEPVQLLPTVVTATQANDLLDSIMHRCRPGTIIVATPTYASFPLFDGFVYFKESNQEVRKLGYQAELGRAYPTEPVPAFLEQALILRGQPPTEAVQSGPGGASGRWRCHSEKEIDTLLGASLLPLKPSAWPEQPAEDSAA